MRISDWSSDVCSSDLTGLAIQHRAPRHEGEFPALLDKRKPPAGKIHATQQPPFDRTSCSRLNEGLAQPASQLVAGTKEFTSLKHHDSVGAKPNAITTGVHQLLHDPPFLSARTPPADGALQRAAYETTDGP